MNKNETIADIRKEAEAEFREFIEKHEPDDIKQFRAMQRFNHAYDRIEAAAARMEQHAQNHATRHAEAMAAGNCRDCVLRGGIAATMREALGKLRAGLWNSSVIAGKRRLELYEIADAAIASAARQSPFKESEVAK